MKWIKDRFPILVVFAILVAGYAALVWQYQSNKNTIGTERHTPLIQSFARPPVCKDAEGIACKKYEWQTKDEEQYFFQIEDHKAQVRMARYAFFGVILGLIGSSLLVWTLKFTRDASISAKETLRIAQDTLSETQKSTRLDMQPYLSCEWVKVRDSVRVEGSEVQIMAQVSIKNNGKTPAHLRAKMNTFVASLTSVTPWSKSKDLAGGNSSNWLYIAPNESENFSLYMKFNFARLKSHEVDINQIKIRGSLVLFYGDEFTKKEMDKVASFDLSGFETVEIKGERHCGMVIKQTNPTHVQKIKRT